MPTDTPVTELPKYECLYEYHTTKPGLPPTSITDPDSPIWEEILKTGRDLGGSFVVNELTRAKSGEILGRKCVTCIQESPIPARERMRRFQATGDHLVRAVV